MNFLVWFLYTWQGVGPISLLPSLQMLEKRFINSENRNTTGQKKMAFWIVQKNNQKFKT